MVRPGWNAVFLKVAAPQFQLEQLLKDGKVSEIVVRTTGPGTIMENWPALGGGDWKDDTYLWRSRIVDIDKGTKIADEDITNVAGALSAGRCYVLKSLLEEEERVTVRSAGTACIPAAGLAGDGWFPVRRICGRQQQAEH